MKIWKSSMLIVGICVLLLSSMTVSAETDASGDVLHWTGTTDWHDWGWNVADRPNIDITNISYSIEGRLTISMSVAGSFNTGLSLYHLEFNSPDAYYRVVYNPESGVDPIVTALPTDLTLEEFATYVQPPSETSIQDGALMATIDWITEDHTMTEFYGWAQEWETEDEKALEAWLDYAPDSHSPYGSYDDYYGSDGGNGGSGSGGDDDNGGLPGFEVVSVIAALGVAFIVMRRKRK